MAGPQGIPTRIVNYAVALRSIGEPFSPMLVNPREEGCWAIHLDSVSPSANDARFDPAPEVA